MGERDVARFVELMRTLPGPVFGYCRSGARAMSLWQAARSMRLAGRSFLFGLRRYLPLLEWAPAYSRKEAEHDVLAAVIVTTMLVPQILAYAMLAGLPPHVGLYASILPLVAYAVFGTSRTLAVGRDPTPG